MILYVKAIKVSIIDFLLNNLDLFQNSFKLFLGLVIHLDKDTIIQTYNLPN